MSFTLEKLADPPVVLCTINSTSLMEDLPDMASALNALLDAEPESLDVIFDWRGLKTSLDDIMQAATAATRGAGAFMNHANIREVLVVATDKLVTLGAQGLRSATFGMVKVETFDTLEAALAHARDAFT